MQDRDWIAEAHSRADARIRQRDRLLDGSALRAAQLEALRIEELLCKEPHRVTQIPEKTLRAFVEGKAHIHGGSPGLCIAREELEDLAEKRARRALRARSVVRRGIVVDSARPQVKHRKESP